MFAALWSQAFEKLEKPKPDAALTTAEEKDKFYDKWCAVRFLPPFSPPCSVYSNPTVPGNFLRRGGRYLC